MTGNVTSDFPTIFRTISATLGFDPTVLFLAGFGLFAFSLMVLKAPRMAYPLSLVIYLFFGAKLGLIPTWLPIMGFIFTIIFSLREFTKALVGGDLPPERHIPNPILTIEATEPEVEHTENCKNCGGPNVDRVTCAYCGQVLE